jgi:ribosomal subunit interface protein
MQIQVNTDRHIEGSADLTSQVESKLVDALSRFTNRITRIEVQLSDENGSKKSSGCDKRCVLEARLTGMQPIKVSANGPSCHLALNGAANKLAKLIDNTLERSNNTRGRTSTA